MKRFFLLLLGYGHTAFSAYCDLKLVTHTPSTQEIDHAQYQALARELSFKQSNLNLDMLAKLNGWNRFGAFAESAQASALAGMSLIDEGTYTQLAGNLNIRNLPLGHADALAIAYLVKRYGAPNLNVFWQLARINKLAFATADQVMVEFATKDLKLVDAAAAIAEAREFIQGALTGQLSHDKLYELYLMRIGAIQNLSAQSLTALKVTLGEDYRAPFAYLIGLESTMPAAELVEWITAARTGAVDWDPLLAILKDRFEPSSYTFDGGLAKRGVRILPADVLELLRQIKAKGISWRIFLALSASAPGAAHMHASSPMPWVQLLALAKAVEENTIEPDYIIQFFRTKTYWPDHGNALDFKRWLPYVQLMHWFAPCLHRPGVSSDDDDAYERTLAELLRPLIGQRITADLITSFRTGDLDLNRYLAVFAKSVAKPTKGLLGWPWRKYSRRAPYDNYENFIAATHAEAMAAAKPL